MVSYKPTHQHTDGGENKTFLLEVKKQKQNKKQFRWKDWILLKGLLL